MPIDQAIADGLKEDLRTAPAMRLPASPTLRGRLITALETIYVIWFFYLFLLFLYDESFFGDRHPAAYVVFGLNIIWAVYLFRRLMMFWKVTTAIRYGIPTAIVAWNAVELGGRWKLFTEFWEYPEKHAIELIAITVGVALAAWLAARTPMHQKAELSKQKLAEAAQRSSGS